MAIARASAEDNPRIAITMDDLNWHAIPEALRAGVDERILAALEQNHLRAALFVIGENGDTPCRTAHCEALERARAHDR